MTMATLPLAVNDNLLSYAAALALGPFQLGLQGFGEWVQFVVHRLRDAQRDDAVAEIYLSPSKFAGLAHADAQLPQGKEQRPGRGRNGLQDGLEFFLAGRARARV